MSDQVRAVNYEKNQAAISVLLEACKKLAALLPEPGEGGKRVITHYDPEVEDFLDAIAQAEKETLNEND